MQKKRNQKFEIKRGLESEGRGDIFPFVVYADNKIKFIDEKSRGERRNRRKLGNI